jgi:hypothetical protein
MVESAGSGTSGVRHDDSVGMEARKADRCRENVNGIYRFVLEELQKESHTVTYRKMTATDIYRDLVGQHRLEP